MSCHRIANGVVCVNPTVTHTYKGREYRWEMHRYMGPWPLNKDGEPRKNTFGVRHLFWEALTDYYKDQLKETTVEER